MATVKTRDEVIDTLVGRGVTRDRATMYAAAYATFHEADANITANGAVVAHPRTGAPLENPYLRIRDKALAALKRMYSYDVTGLW